MSPRRRWLAGAAGAVVALLALAGPALAPADPVASPDPVVLRLLPPGSRVTALVARDGRLLPVTPGPGGEPGFRVLGDRVVYRRGRREREVPLADLARGPGGAPATRELRFPLGTDRLGRDLLSRLLAGARVSLGIGIGGVLGALLLGGVMGAAAARGGALLDAAIGRVGDLFLSLPWVVVAMVIAALWRPGPAGIALLLALVGWPAFARLARAELRGLAGSDAILAARAAGAGPARVLLRHMVPRAGTTLALAAALRVGPFVLLEAALSFLGLGVAPPTPSWGNILADGREVLADAWWVTVFPGVLLVLVVLAANVAADALERGEGTA